ncbi:S66 peptidase family protein [Proteiniborus sp. MB09-C3]|uniref:S66 family peptidase n=1 Tax=Proteiniborus sp. MB09-C3 TaxID=3050072 RepID=UPI0025551000|nr:S66 peptidase family protein [Proteiniborus sp. MB09-C3]WIV10514.1 LD-carboxypeptidase [Proteiniborus sp. MB09-C3]
MIRPKRLKPGDRVAVVSLSWGGLGDKNLIHKYDIAKERLEREFGLEVVAMSNALKGSKFIAEHPELRAKDLMDAFEDNTISAIFCAIGGDDSIRLLPYIDYEVIKNNPKIFMGYSDSTISHLMMYKAGLVSFYGPSVMCEFGEYVSMFEYTKTSVSKMLFEDTKGYQILSSPEWSDDFIPWDEKNRHVAKKLKPEKHGYEILQGTGKVRGHLLGGCLDVFMMCIGTEVWPALEEWKDTILFIETSEDKPSPDFVKWTLRNLAAQGILKVIRGILVGKPQGEVYYEDYKSAILQVVAAEEHLINLPILYNVNFGHAMPIGILPYGIMTEIDCEEKSITLLENVTDQA